MDLKAVTRITYGMYVVCSKTDVKMNGQISNTVCQVTSEPAKISVCINKGNFTHGCIVASKAFSVSVLSQEAPMTFIWKFGFKSGKDTDKFKDTKFILSVSGIPVVTEYTVAHMVAELTDQIDVGTHTLFIGRITEGSVLNENMVMTYDYYHQIKGGKSPKAAPTYSGG